MATARLVHNVHISGDIVDTNTTLREIELPDITNTTIKKIVVDSIANAAGASTISIENTSDASGSNITVTFALGEYHQSNTGTLTTSSSFWIRSGTPNGLADLDIDVHYLPE